MQIIIIGACWQISENLFHFKFDHKWHKVLLFSFCHHFGSLNKNNIPIHSYSKCLYLRCKSQPEVGLCKFMFVKMGWLTVIEGCLCGAPSSVHYERFMASFALSVCFLFLAPGPVLILPWTFAAEGLQRTGGGWIWIAAQVCACCNLHHPPPPLGLCTILFESKCVPKEKVPHRFPVKLYSGPLILLGCHIGPF